MEAGNIASIEKAVGDEVGCLLDTCRVFARLTLQCTQR